MPVTCRMKNSSYYIAPVRDRTHDLPHTVASNVVKVSHALNHSATEAVKGLGEEVKGVDNFQCHHMTARLHVNSVSSSLSPALDAYCLLEVYDVLKHKIDSYQLNVDCRPSKEGTFVKTSSRNQKKHKKAVKPTDVAHKMVSVFTLALFCLVLVDMCQQLQDMILQVHFRVVLFSMWSQRQVTNLPCVWHNLLPLA